MLLLTHFSLPPGKSKIEEKREKKKGEKMGIRNGKWICLLWKLLPSVVVLFAVLLICGFGVVAAHEGSHGQAVHDHDHDRDSDRIHDHHHHHCNHGHHDVDEHQHLRHGDKKGEATRRKLPEELAEEEDLKLYGFGGASHYHHHDHDHHRGTAVDGELSGFGLWMHAIGCSLLVSLASLICLIILPVVFIQGKPSKAVVDSLALFGAGAMLGDAFLHQLPHAFGGEHSHSHDRHLDHAHHHMHSEPEHLPSHSHSLKDLSVGLSILAGIIIFLLVEKLVRYVEETSGGLDALSHGHHHHHPQKNSKKLKADDPQDDKINSSSGRSSKEKELDGVSAKTRNGENKTENTVIRKRNTSTDAAEDEANANAVVGSNNDSGCKEKEPAQAPSTLVFGYLNLFSDGVHNFTDGMALGSAFLLYGSIGGWSRTLFLLAHELPQEIGDFGILVRSGFSASKALFFNFLSALTALGGTALALTLGQDPGQSSLIEGFTAGGFIYIAVAGVLSEMNNGSLTLKGTVTQLLSLMMGMGVALCISLIE